APRVRQESQEDRLGAEGRSEAGRGASGERAQILPAVLAPHGGHRGTGGLEWAMDLAERAEVLVGAGRGAGWALNANADSSAKPFRSRFTRTSSPNPSGRPRRCRRPAGRAPPRRSRPSRAGPHSPPTPGRRPESPRPARPTWRPRWARRRERPNLPRLRGWASARPSR